MSSHLDLSFEWIDAERAALVAFDDGVVDLIIKGSVCIFSYDLHTHTHTSRYPNDHVLAYSLCAYVSNESN